MRLRLAASVFSLAVAAAACSGSDAVLVGNSVLAASAAVNPPVLRGIDDIVGWTRAGDAERFKKETLYGYIDGGAEIVLQYGFRELSVSKYKPAAGPGSATEIVLEIYRMTSGEAAFGLYSIKLEGGEKGWPGIKADNWVGPGQASLVKGEYLVNVLGPDTGEKELGEFLSAVERKVPGRGTVRPEALAWLPREGLVPSSWRVIKGPLAAQNESPFLEGGFWGFDADAGNKDATAAFSAKYGTAPAVSKLVVVKLGKNVPGAEVDKGARALFGESLGNVGQDLAGIHGQNEAGRWFLYGRAGSVAGLVLGEPDEQVARARLAAALDRVAGRH